MLVEASGDGDSQRPDALLRSPRGFGRQMILDVAATGVDGQSRASDDFPDRALQIRRDQKMAKRGHVADHNRLQLAPAASSHAGQAHLLGEQTRQSLVAFEGQAKPSKTKSATKRWSKRVAMATAKTAS